MGLPLRRLETEALELPSGERAQLAKSLLVSLDDEPEEDLDEVERAWEVEIRRRIAELDAGTAELIPAEEVFAELRARPRR
ncbi:MAG TPA: addiction module protein [Longimicrobium sp.]|jgi:putative addiction module component (TIGR02574 family)|nr:addiction module protein [Longimicrobium sp.]